MSHTPIATFFGGVNPCSEEEQGLAYYVGCELGALGFTLHHGGYNGLMEHAAAGAASVGAPVVAVTLAGKEEWGEFNPHVTDSIYAPDMGVRLGHLVNRADVIVGMGGGVGSLHELTAAIWYAGNVRRVPVVLVGQTACRLLTFLKQERWLYESSTRPLDFLHTAQTATEFRRVVAELSTSFWSNRDAGDQPEAGDQSLEARIRRAAFVHGRYQLASGTVLSDYFDPFRLAADPGLSADVAEAMAQRMPSEPDVVVGLALGGVTLASNLSRVLDRPPGRFGSGRRCGGVRP